MAYITLTVAVRGGRKETTFFPVVVFGESAEPAAKYVTKGWQVLVEGRPSFNKNGRLKVVTDSVRFGPPAGGKSVDETGKSK